MQTPSPSQSGSSPVPAGPEHTGNGGLAALKKSLEMLHLKTFSPIQAAVGDLASGINMMETVTRNRKDYKNVVLELEDMADTVDKYVREAMSEQIASRMSKIVEIIRKEIGEVKMRQAQGRTRQMLTASENEEDIVHGWSLEKECLANMRLENLGHAKLARYNSSLSTTIKRRKCTKNTRVGVLAELIAW
ncbi:unnamed protein product, partial [Rhizoctonia solani]